MGRWECSQQYAWQELVYVTSCSIDGKLEMIACFESFLVSQFSYSFATNMENLFMSKSFSQICCGNNSLLKKHQEGVLSFQRMCSCKDKRVFKLLIDQVPFVFGHTKNENKNEDNRDNIKYYGVL